MSTPRRINKVGGMRFEVHHHDHGVTRPQLTYICGELEKNLTGAGVFILRVQIPSFLGKVPCGLYGPTMGDQPIEDEDVVFWKRGNRPYLDRCVALPLRMVDYVQAIGELDTSGFCALATTFGGPLAPMNAEDTACKDIQGSKEFWASHALSIANQG